jgi:hypothetical protein
LAKFHNNKSLKGVWSCFWPNLVPKCPCLKSNGFEPMWTTIVPSSKGIGAQISIVFSNAICHYFVSLILTLNLISSIVSSMLLCNISIFREMVARWSIKSQTIISIFEDHSCNVSNILFTYAHWKRFINS